MSRVKMVLSIAVVAGCSGGMTPPPFGVPITGGTLLLTRSGQAAVVSDPDRDRIATVDLATGTTLAEVPLTPGDEPGRVVEDGAGRLHIALRRGGAVLTLADATSGAVLARRFACAEPRGLAWEAATDSIHVACAGGELVTFPAAGGDARRRLRLDRDLRDVVVSGDRLVITRFRSAEALVVDASGAVIQRLAPPPVFRFNTGGIAFALPGEAVASVAWRAIGLPGGTVLLSHQRAVDRVLDDEDQHQGGYGDGCRNGPVEASLTMFPPGGQPPVALAPIASGALPVDFAASPDGTKMALVLAGQKTVTVMDAPTVISRLDQERCGGGDDDDDNDEDLDADLGAPTSAAFTPLGDLVVFYPERPALVVREAAGGKRLLPLSGEPSRDPGRAIFHAQTPLQLACASCHPEGRDDGRVWQFAQSGPRRTQSLAGDLLERAPFHWSGDMRSLDVLMDDVFSLRMSGGPVDLHQKAGLAAFLGRLPAPAPAPAAEPAAIERGRAIFESAQAGCATCHGGALLTNHQLVDVGTGGRFKVPSLVGVGARAPYMHDGCAATLADRFGLPGCGGGDAHGRTSQLSQAEIADLIAYLESL
jgi:mono/diheme cytochrome c family protein